MFEFLKKTEKGTDKTADKEARGRKLPSCVVRSRVHVVT